MNFSIFLYDLVRYIKVVADWRELAQLSANDNKSMLVLASGNSLEMGPSRRILFDWAANPQSLLVLTQDSYPEGSLADHLLGLSEQSTAVDAKGRPVLQKFDIEFQVLILFEFTFSLSCFSRFQQALF